MASAIAHSVLAVTLSRIYPHHKSVHHLWLLAIICSVLPDIDVIGHWLGIPYSSVWGHRGITHSFLFAAVSAVLVTRIAFPGAGIFSFDYGRLVLFYFLLTASHGLLDGMTNGGLGIAFFAPFDNTRYFLPWRPLQVSPIGISAFFGEWGWKVLKNEMIWIGIPCLILLLFRIKIIRR